MSYLQYNERYRHFRAYKIPSKYASSSLNLQSKKVLSPAKKEIINILFEVSG